MKSNQKQVGIAMLVCLGMMAGSFLVVRAAPISEREQLPGISFWVAVIVGVLYYLANSPWLACLS